MTVQPLDGLFVEAGAWDTSDYDDRRPRHVTREKKLDMLLEHIAVAEERLTLENESLARKKGDSRAVGQAWRERSEKLAGGGRRAAAGGGGRRAAAGGGGWLV